MTLDEFLVDTIRLVYGLLGVVSVAAFLRHRDRVRQDIALLFGLFGAVNLIQEYLLLTGGEPGRWLALFFKLVQIAHGYLLLRLVQHFRTVPAWLLRVAVGGMLVLSAVAVLLPTWPAPLTAAMVFYLALLDLYSVGALLRGALAARGVARRRMQFGALGIGLLATALVLAGVIVLWPAVLPAALILIEFVALFSGIAFYIGFAPPRPLRRAWQLAELEHFLSSNSTTAAGATVAEALQRLAVTAVQGVGGRAALVLAPPNWQVAATTDAALSEAIAHRDRPATDWHHIAAGHAVVVPRLDEWFQGQPANRLAAEAQTALAVPVKTAKNTWGVLVVLLRRGSLFPDDDLHLLALLTEQIGLTIEQWALIGDLRQQTVVLEQANRQLETANRELEAFTYSVSHDLRTPLRHIEGFAQLLSDAQVVAEPHRRSLDNILSATARMAHLIEALLALSRLGRADLTLTQVPLDTLVQQARADLVGEIGKRNIGWKIEPLPEITGDPILLRQVFSNLLSNAVKYTRPRPDAVIEIGRAASDPGEVVVYVRDNGVGFSAAYAHRLFTVFQRLHHPNEFEGEGIGLANVRRIVQRHGGRVWAESLVDAGATFFVALPLPDAEPMPSGAAQVSQIPVNA